MIELVALGSSRVTGHLALPPGRTGPGILVVQEWWGIDWGIKQMAERLAAAGFVALVPDLYHGELVGHDEVDAAEALMHKLPAERAARDMSAAVDYLSSHPAVAGQAIGVVGFCMGGLLAFHIASLRGDKVKALVPFYGYPIGGVEPDWSGLSARVRGHMAEHDKFFPPAGALALESKLRALGKDVQLQVYPGSAHAFMGPHDAFGTLDTRLSAQIWPLVVSFLHETLI